MNVATVELGGEVSECRRCEISALNATFARSLDDGDLDALLGTFTKDAVYDNGRARLEGHVELDAWFRARSKNESRTTRHMWGSLQVLRSSADVVETVSTWMVFAANERAPVDTALVGNVADFSDVLQLVDGVWKIHRRVIRSVFRNPSVAPPTVQ